MLAFPRTAVCMILVLAAEVGCRGPAPRQPTGPDHRIADLDRRYERISAAATAYGRGGREVLDVAYRVLRAGQAAGKWRHVGLEDLWTEALQEGASLFEDPARRWGRTTAAETKDMLGQTTIGPWQITIDNVRNTYGRPYGVEASWSDREIYEFCRERPHVQAAMICDYIEEAYTKYGRRGPYGIQRYFWLEGFVRGWIGQGRWDKSVLPTPPDGDWRKLTPEMKADTGFYAKQVVCGWPGSGERLLYWLCVTGDDEGIRELLRAWRDQRRMVWDDARGEPVLTDDPGGFAIRPDDLGYLASSAACHDMVLAIVHSVLCEGSDPAE